MAKQNLNNSKSWKSSSYVYSPISALLTVCMSFFFPFVPCWGKEEEGGSNNGLYFFWLFICTGVWRIMMAKLTFIAHTCRSPPSLLFFPNPLKSLWFDMNIEWYIWLNLMEIWKFCKGCQYKKWGFWIVSGLGCLKLEHMDLKTQAG